MGIRVVTAGGGKAVFLDRDGVINQAVVREGKPYPPANLAELVVLPGVPQALFRLRQAGYLTLVVTNQPDLARGTLLPEVLEALHAHLLDTLPLDGIDFCPHDDPDGCDCRKPLPGMLLRGAKRYDLSLADCVMVGDRWRDIEAGRRAGCSTVFISCGYAEKQPDPPADHTAVDLVTAVDWILAL